MINDEITQEKEEDNPRERMVMVSQRDAEWLTQWRERCEVGSVSVRWVWRFVLAALGLSGAVGLAINQWASVVHKFTGT